MKIFIVDAFTNDVFQGNQAGVVILEKGEPFPEPGYMKALAAELKHSETAFVRHVAEEVFQLRFFTPVEEVELCGHATISSFTVLREEGYIGRGSYKADTLAGKLNICAEENMIWMDMARPKCLSVFRAEECCELYDAFGLDSAARPDSLYPQIVNAGLNDILLPVRSREILNGVLANMPAVRGISQKYDVVGVHLFCISDVDGVTAYCRNFAPLYGIEEESATGTSNGALTYYLRQHQLINDDGKNLFLQGEAMGKPSCIYSTIRDACVKVGGRAVLSLECRRYRKQ